MENSEAVPLLRYATQKRERPHGRTCCAYIRGRCAPPNHPATKKERLYEAVSELTLAFSGRALAPLPHPPRASTKTKTWLWMVEVGPAFVPECRAVRDRTERPQDEHGAMPPAPVYPKYA